MLSKNLLTILFTILYTSLTAQTTDPIQADRPGAGDSPSITPKGYFQGEQGFTLKKTGTDEKSLSIPTILWKYGIFDNTELRLITDIVSVKTGNSSITGLSPITIGFKTKLTDEKGALPLTSFIGHLGLPTLATKKLTTTYYNPSFGLLMHNSLSEKVSLDYNLGASWNGESPESTFFYAVSAGYNLIKKLDAFIELYGYAPQYQRANHNFDFGLTYLLNANMLLDISGGFGLTTNASPYFISFGFSYRLNTVKEIKQ